MKSPSLNALMFFLPYNISSATIVNVSLCILLVFSLIVLFRRVNLEGMGTMNGSNPLVEDLKKDFDIMQTTYAQLKNGIDDQKNRIDANAQMLLKVMGDTPEKTNDLTHANVNMDDPSKTRIPNVM